MVSRESASSTVTMKKKSLIGIFVKKLLYAQMPRILATELPTSNSPNYVEPKSITFDS